MRFSSRHQMSTPETVHSKLLSFNTEAVYPRGGRRFFPEQITMSMLGLR